jgi:hypothetical protein
MFYHEPKIAVLDECTSAVSVDVEEGLYRRAVERGITLVTLSQQMTLPEFHPLEIVIGENKTAGWTVREVDMTMKNRLLSKPNRIQEKPKNRSWKQCLECLARLAPIPKQTQLKRGGGRLRIMRHSLP